MRVGIARTLGIARVFLCMIVGLAGAGVFTILGVNAIASASSTMPLVHPSVLVVVQLSQKEQNVILVTRYVYRDNRGQITRSSIEWRHGNSMRAEDLNAKDVPVREEFGTYRPGKFVGDGVNFTDHTWIPNPFQGAAPPSISQTETSIRKALASKQIRVLGHRVLNGVEATEVSCLISTCGSSGTPGTFTEWINQSTGAPIELIGTGSDNHMIETFALLTPNLKNLRLLTATVPPTFHNCTQLPANALTIAKCLIAY